MAVKCFAIFALFVVVATVFVSNTEATPLETEAVDAVATAEAVAPVSDTAEREDRQYLGYPGLYGGGLYGTGNSAAAAAAAAASSTSNGIGYPYGRK